MDTGLRDKVIFLTGASGGIGGATARVLAAEGCRLALQGFGQFDRLQQMAREHGWQDRALCLRFDVNDRAATFDAMHRAAEHFGRVDACVANAGTWPPEDVPFHEMDEQRVRSTVGTNLLGAAWTAQAFLSQLAANGPRADGHGASLVFTGSTAGRFGERDHCDYSMSKAGMVGLVKSLKNEITRIDPFGRVNMVSPGWTVTEMARPSLQDDALVTRVVRTMGLRQFGRAEDIARTIAYLCSPLLARHVSGETLTVAGGMEGRLLWDEEQVDPAAIRARLEQE